MSHFMANSVAGLQHVKSLSSLYDANPGNFYPTPAKIILPSTESLSLKALRGFDKVVAHCDDGRLRHTRSYPAHRSFAETTQDRLSQV